MHNANVDKHDQRISVDPLPRGLGVHACTGCILEVKRWGLEYFLVVQIADIVHGVRDIYNLIKKIFTSYGSRRKTPVPWSSEKVKRGDTQLASSDINGSGSSC